MKKFYKDTIGRFNPEYKQLLCIGVFYPKVITTHFAITTTIVQRDRNTFTIVFYYNHVIQHIS